MIALVITGGQTGADQGGWRAAKAAGIACDGWMPPHFMTEEGPRPAFSTLYGARAMPISDSIVGGRSADRKIDWAEAYRARNRLNAPLANGVVYFTWTGWSSGMKSTIDAIQETGAKGNYPFMKVAMHGPAEAEMGDWIVEQRITKLWVAGNRESKSPGIGEWVERYLSEVFRLLREAGEPVVLGRPPVTLSPSASPAAPPHPEDDEERP
jgi:hypothetical protein